jgi:AcrR family transcriptional regulator
MAKASMRMSADERRESVVLAAMSEFARGGYNGTSTQAIASRVGVSQPYLFRLFPSKKALFMAAVARCMEDTIGVFEAAGEDLVGVAALDAMAEAYLGLITDREKLLMQLQVYVSSGSADLDDADREQVRQLWGRLWDTVAIRTGADVQEVTSFFAHGMLINTLVAMGVPEGDRLWAGFDWDCWSARSRDPLQP